jgi:hypothetical protein
MRFLTPSFMGIRFNLDGFSEQPHAQGDMRICPGKKAMREDFLKIIFLINARIKRN